jgi:GxxExxY protein
LALVHDSALTERAIKLAMVVHRQLGPGLLESAYEECLCFELAQAGVSFARQVPLPLIYKDVRLDCGYRIDLILEDQLVVEVKAVEKLLPLHEAQLLTYLKLSGHKIGLLMNFNTLMLKDGIRRFVMG